MVEESKDNEDKGNQGGRPPKFKSATELDQLIASYFANCDPHIEERMVESGIDQNGRTLWLKREIMTEQQPYGVNSLAAALGTTRETLSVYESGVYDKKAEDYSPDGRWFSDAIKEAKARIKAYVETQLFIGKQATGAIFWLKNNDGWKDKTETDLTSGGEKLKTVTIVDLKGDKEVDK